MNVTKNKEILIIYNSRKLKDRKAVGYAQSIKNKKIKTIDLQKDRLTETQLKRIAMELDVMLENLIDKQSPTYRKYLRDVNLSGSNILKVLKNHPTMLHSPILLYDEGGEFVDNSYDFIRKDMHFK